MTNLKIDLRHLQDGARLNAAASLQRKAFSLGLQYRNEGKRVQHLDSPFFYLDFDDGLIREGTMIASFNTSHNQQIDIGEFLNA